MSPILSTNNNDHVRHVQLYTVCICANYFVMEQIEVILIIRIVGAQYNVYTFIVNKLSIIIQSIETIFYNQIFSPSFKFHDLFYTYQGIIYLQISYDMQKNCFSILILL